MTAPIEDLLALPEDDILERIGFWYGRDPDDRDILRAGADPVADRQRGYQLFSRIQPVLVERVCTDWNACEKVKKRVLANKVDLVSALADLLTAHVAGLPVVLVSVLIAKIGIEHLCDCE